MPIGARTSFLNVAEEIKRSLWAKNKWFSEEEVHYEKGPILFIFRECRNSPIRNYPNGCTFFKISPQTQQFGKKVIQLRGVLPHDIRDVLMLMELFKMRLNDQDALVWQPNQPLKAKLANKIRRTNSTYYGQDYYVYIINLAQHGDFTLRLENIRLQWMKMKKKKKREPKDQQTKYRAAEMTELKTYSVDRWDRAKACCSAQ